MKFLRKKDEIGYMIASTEARIFEKSAEEGISSYLFIQAFANSFDAYQFDTLGYLLSGSSETEVYLHVKAKIKKKNGTVYPKKVMHWMGFFYRYASYLTNVSSKELFKKISPKYLNTVYPLYHSVDIVKAVKMVFEDVEFEKLTPAERFLNLYKNNKIIF